MPPAPAPIPAGRLACRSPDRRANSRLWAHLSRHARGFREPLRSRAQGEIAQLVEHTTENRGVLGSIPSLATHESTATLHLSGRTRSPPRSVSSAPRSSQYDAEAVARFPNPCTSGTRVGRASQRPACFVLSQPPLGVCCGQPPFRHRAGRARRKETRVSARQVRRQNRRSNESGAASVSPVGGEPGAVQVADFRIAAMRQRVGGRSF